MARTTKRGVCELCGASANVGMNHGAKVCPQCTHVQSALNKRIESVAAAARSMGKTEELLSALIPAGGGIAVKMTADFLQEISGIVGYDGEDPGELVAAVIKATKACASCDAESVLHEIREIVDYSPDMGDSGLADAVRAFGDSRPAAAIQTIAELTNRRDDLVALLTKERADNANLRNEIARLNGQTHSESEEMTELRADLEGSEREIVHIRSQLTLAQQANDEWKSRAVQAESNVETLEAELRNREDAPAVPCASTTYLLDIAMRALRGEGPDADQLATLIDAARRAA